MIRKIIMRLLLGRKRAEALEGILSESINTRIEALESQCKDFCGCTIRDSDLDDWVSLSPNRILSALAPQISVRDAVIFLLKKQGLVLHRKPAQQAVVELVKKPAKTASRRRRR